MKFKIFYLIYLIISLIITGLVLYKSEIIWDGLRRSYYLKFYIISFFLPLISLFLSKSIKQIIVITFFSFLITSYFFEFYLTSIKQDKNIELKTIILKETTGKIYDKKTRKEKYNELKKKGNKVTLSFFPEYWVFKKNKNIFPLSGISNIDNILCSDEGTHQIFKSDKYGFRNNNNVWDKKKVDYVIVGDSFAQGFCVDESDHITSHINRITNKNVINLAYGSNGPLIQFASIREYLPENTKNLIWFYFEGNDLDNLDN